MSESILAHNVSAGKRWGTAAEGYEAFSEHFADAIAHCVEGAAVGRGDRVLDIATGTGWAARLLASSGAKVVGIDFGEDLILAARRLARKAGVDIDFQVGDAEALVFGDAAFDVVVSSFGVIFAGDHQRAAGEIKRVCRPGGRLAMTAWTADGVIARYGREVHSRYSPTPPVPMTRWGDPAYAQSLLGDAFDLRVESAATILRAPSGEAVWDLWRRSSGPTMAILAQASPEQQRAFQADFISFHEQYRGASGIEMPREYHLYTGTRR